MSSDGPQNPYTGDQPSWSNPEQQPTPPPGQPYGYPGPPMVPMYGYGYPMPQANQKALWSMVLGIIALVCSVFLYCLFIAGLACGIPAIILGVLAKKEIDAARGAQSGSGQATAGIVCGIVAIVINLLLSGLLIAVFATDGFGDPTWDY
ncbi:MAG: DUF4190 domain-containing protein [Aeromicrobium sp.]|uniref:DUF4190 domain-containing protein n=1 Tax=Aeromicrobium sp. TaxID=1871063 RepID=UPI0039E2E0BE